MNMFEQCGFWQPRPSLSNIQWWKAWNEASFWMYVLGCYFEAFYECQGPKCVRHSPLVATTPKSSAVHTHTITAYLPCTHTHIHTFLSQISVCRSWCEWGDWCVSGSVLCGLQCLLVLCVWCQGLHQGQDHEGNLSDSYSMSIESHFQLLLL